MAFQTIPGSATDPAQFLGTSGPDQVAILSIPGTGASTFYSEGREGDDLWNIGVSAPNFTILGGQGNDLVTTNIIGTNVLSGALIELNQGEDEFGNAALEVSATISTLQGGQGNDTMWVGDSQSSYINGNRGDDTLILADSDNNPGGDFDVTDRTSIFGGQGNDLISIELDDDFSALTNSSVFGALGNDTILADIDTNAAGTVFDGGEGNDFLSGLGSQAALTLVGGLGNDSVTGGSGRDSIEGNDGDDFLVGGGGRDSVSGANGSDVVYGGRDDFAGDFLSGGTGGNRFVSRDDDSDDYGVTAPGTGTSVLGNGFQFTWDPSGVDVITDWSSASAGTNVIDTGIIGSLLIGNVGQPQNMSFGITTAGDKENKNIAIRGFFSADTQSFVTAQNGSDILITQTSGNVTGNWTSGDFNTDMSTVLLGAGNVSVLQASNFVFEGTVPV